MVISTEGERVSENSLEEREGFTQVINFEEDDDEAFLTLILDAISKYSHGTRTCIKRKKIIHGKFFYFCAEKCI